MKLKTGKQQRKSTKSLEKNKIDKPLAGLLKKTRELRQITNIKNESAAITTIAEDTEEIISENYEQMNICTPKFDNFDEMEAFLEGHKLPKLTQGKISNLLKKLNQQ